MRSVWILMPVLVLVAGVARPVRAAGKDSAVAGTMAADVSAVTPGSSFTVAVELAMHPGWHIYWSNPGDAGEATKLTYQAPAGYDVTPAAFPLPEKFVQAGDIVAYGYEGKVVFLATVTAPKELPAGTTVRIGVHVSWLCCKDECVPGGANLSLELPVEKAGGTAKGGDHGANHELFEKARAEIPREAPTPAEVSGVEAGPGELTIAWKHPPQGEVTIFPLSPDAVEVSDIKAQTQGGKTRVTLHARLLAGLAMKTEALPLLVAYEDGKGVRHGFFTNWSLQAMATGGK